MGIPSVASSAALLDKALLHRRRGNGKVLGDRHLDVVARTLDAFDGTAVALDEEGSLPQAPVPDYADETVSTKVVKIIQSYTGVVDKMVWRKGA